MKRSLISIIVPCFNQSETIIETLESVLSQTYSNWECIIVNDGSTDDSQLKIERFIQNDTRFKVKHIKNSGICVARNTAISYAQGEYLFPLDGDDYIHKDCLGRCLTEFTKNPNLKLVCPQGQLFGAEKGLWILPAYDYITILKFNVIHNSSLFLREDFERVGGYRLNMIHGLEDWDFFIALLYGYSNEQVVKISEPLFYYRVNYSGRRLTVAANGRQQDMLDLLIYNNFLIYKEYFPDVFSRILEYDFHKTMFSKPGVRMIVNLYLFLSKIKRRLIQKEDKLKKI